ncbi:aquaporin-like protein [Clohesyomyces aquaticus]|uniref:Aquaporin-like protein n=1 Tax=Clohesyomyces aquaticus TaxID=1231657 RepID=A0A1Y2AAZ1_9PLEO|nr:aquaporin-like protein [Clohesyomyces aquaticus]
MNTNAPADNFVVLPGMKPSYTTDPTRPGERRLAGCGWLPNRVRVMLISMVGEFVGTYLFLFFAFAATQVANSYPSRAGKSPDVGVLLYIALAFGFSLAVNVWIFFRITGGLFNPAVTVALALVGAIGWMKALLLIISQVLAGISAAGLVSAIFPGPLAVRTRLNPYTSVTRGLFIEMFLTAELIFTIFMLAAEKHKATFLAPLGIGLSLFIAELAGVYFTGGSLNPARSFGPDAILRNFDGYHWIYWVGPLLGAILAVLFYRFIKTLEYETANPGADCDGQEIRYIVDEQADDRRAASRRTDGTDETGMLPPVQSINMPTYGNAFASSHRQTTSMDTNGSTSIPMHTVPAFKHGGDGHQSRPTSIKHPEDRPRAQHRRSSSSRRHSHPRHYERHETDTESCYSNGPSAESGQADHHQSSRSSSQE